MIRDKATPRFAYKEYAMSIDGDKVVIDGRTTFVSADLSRHLKGCRQCVILAATLGHTVDRILKKLQYTDMAKALETDIQANLLIEEICDNLQEQIAKQALDKGHQITNRYGVGYGDFLLENQSTLLRLSGIKGITVTDSNLLLPQKSVTAIVGVRE
ncbi:MAG: hypothetical protein FWC80_01945 [Firmicutes bacterium]|nr:hypothetical protein [Bacillota bacterium]